MTLRITITSIAAALTLSLAACGDDAKTSATDSSSTTTASTTESATNTGTGTGTGTATETAGGPQSGICIEACEVDADCQLGGVDMGFFCEDAVCVTHDGLCEDDEACVALLSGWIMPCDDQAACPGQVCIDVGGEGRCATAPSDVIMCDAFGLDEVTRKTFPGGQDTPVCAESTAVCAGACFVPCQTDADCPSSSYPTCDAGTGRCGCSDDSHCADVPGTSVCDGGTCKCATDSDCDDSPIGDVCESSGYCGCTGTEACKLSATFDGTTVTCWTGQ